MSDINLTEALTEEAIDSALFDEPGDDAVEDTPIEDVEASDQPATPSEEVADAPETADDAEEDETDEESTDEEEPATPTQEALADEAEETPSDDDKLNWSSAPAQFREQYDRLKKTVLESNTLQDKYFEGPTPFLEALHGLSTKQFQDVTQKIIERGIEAMPDEFAGYINEVAPDAVAKTLAKANPQALADALDLGMPLEQAKRIINQVKRQNLEGYLNDNDDGDTASPPKKPEITAEVAKTPPSAPVQAMTPEEIDRLVAQKVAEADKPKQIEALKQKTYVEIMAPVEAALEEAGLKPSATDNAEDKAFKEWATERILKDTFEYLLEGEKASAQTQKILEMIDNLDENGVKHLTPVVGIKAQDYALKQIQMLTNQRAKTRTKAKTTKIPPKVVPPAGGVPAFGNATAPAKSIADLSDADYASVGL